MNENVQPGAGHDVTWLFLGALSYVPVHNALVGAYHNTNMAAWLPSHDSMWTIPTDKVPVKVRRAVDAETVLVGIRQGIAEARRAIEGVRAAIDCQCEHVVYHTPDRPYDNLHSSVVVTRRETPGYLPGWAYTFNTYALAVTLLDEYERFVNVIARRRRLGTFAKLARICEKAKELDNNVSLVTGEMTSRLTT